MGRKQKKYNLFAQKKRERKEGNSNEKADRPSEPYFDIIRENELFLKYYKHQKICPEAEWDEFLKFISCDLPTTFRITASRGEAQTLLDIIKSEFFADYLKGALELQNTTGCKFEKPMSLPWYPNEHAWQLELSRKDIRRSEAFYKLHNFLIAETNSGSISRQEAVSMIPPIVLDVKPHHKVLDMCAAPGSKTAQLIEALHVDSENSIPTGFVIANDVDNNRCYMLVHQARRLNSPCFIVTNHDSCFLPNFLMTNSDGQKEEVKFDRVLCDVVCSGDATLRKNPDIWLKWNQGQALNLHGVQFRLAKRGAELLAIGGKMVYSTCSLNPVENEAVLHRLIKDSEGALEIVDSASLVPGLKYIPGLTTWDLASKEIECFKSFEDVPEKYHTIIRPQMFPPSPEDASKYNLEKCIRILPHFQNTGGFFVASIVKKSYLPWEKEAKKQEASKSDEQTEQTSTESEKSNSTEPQRKKRRLFHGYKEDPYVFLTPEDLAWSQLKNFYKLSDEFNPLCLLTRSVSEKKKNIYFCSEQIRDLLLCNESSVKIINTGVKTFVRCDNRNMECPFRLANEGLPNINFMIGECRRLNICKDDLIILLNNTDPTKPPPLATLTEETQENVKSLGAGSCVLKYSDDKLTVSLVGWRGQTSLRAYVDTNDTVHILRLLGADLSKYDVNKFQKKQTAGNEVVQSADVEQTECVEEAE